MTKEEFLDRLEALEEPDKAGQLLALYDAHFGDFEGQYTSLDLDRIESSVGYASLLQAGAAAALRGPVRPSFVSNVR